MAFNVRLIIATSGAAPHPSAEATAPSGFKILGGGAFDHWSGAGNLLTASFPKTPQTWVAAGKDHEDASPASITSFAFALEDPINEWDVVIKSETSNPAHHPQAVAFLPPGYILTGGGAFVQWGGAGNLLTASFPNSATSWEARSKDHDIGDSARITAYAIGLRHRSGVQPHGIMRQATGASEPHPTAQACLDAGWVLTGGGAIDNWNGAGNLLTASYPEGRCWRAAAKDHRTGSPASITAYVIGVRP